MMLSPAERSLTEIGTSTGSPSFVVASFTEISVTGASESLRQRTDTPIFES